MPWATILTHRYGKRWPTTPTHQSQVRAKTEKKIVGLFLHFKNECFRNIDCLHFDLSQFEIHWALRILESWSKPVGVLKQPVVCSYGFGSGQQRLGD